MSARAHHLESERAKLVLRVGTELSMYTWRNLDIVIWEATPTLQGAREMSRILPELTRGGRESRSSVHVLTERGGFPSDEVRAEWEAFVKNTQRSRACIAVVLEMEGFRASAIKALATGLLVLSAQHRQSRVFSTLHEAARWLPAPHEERTGTRLDPGDLLRVLQELRARHP